MQYLSWVMKLINVGCSVKEAVIIPVKVKNILTEHGCQSSQKYKENMERLIQAVSINKIQCAEAFKMHKQVISGILEKKT